MQDACLCPAVCALSPWTIRCVQEYGAPMSTVLHPSMMHHAGSQVPDRHHVRHWRSNRAGRHISNILRCTPAGGQVGDGEF